MHGHYVYQVKMQDWYVDQGINGRLLSSSGDKCKAIMLNKVINACPFKAISARSLHLSRGYMHDHYVDQRDKWKVFTYYTKV